jgi:predicted DCC family thiol-disulfide oxidoreductase YuxK
MAKAGQIVLYDDQCPMCTFQMRVLTWLDWFNAAALMPMSDPRLVEVAPTVSREALAAAIHCLSPDGRIYRGARCIRHVGMRMPLLVPLALFLWIPGVIQVAEVIYRWISRNRYLLSRVFGCKEACAILPERRREQPKPMPTAEGP